MLHYTNVANVRVTSNMTHAMSKDQNIW